MWFNIFTCCHDFLFVLNTIACACNKVSPVVISLLSALWSDIITLYDDVACVWWLCELAAYVRVFVLKEKEKGYIPSARDIYLPYFSFSFESNNKNIFNLKFKLVCPFTLCELNAEFWTISACVLCVSMFRWCAPLMCHFDQFLSEKVRAFSDNNDNDDYTFKISQ